MAKQKTNPVRCQIKVVLRDSQPSIWRRIVVRSDLSLRTIHNVLQVVMGWTNSHMHQFLIKEKSYGFPDPDGELEMIDDSKVRLEQLVTGKGQCLTYEYDFGDSWDHYLSVEEVLPMDNDKPPALCLAGSRACPPEDVGGMGGYENFLNIIRAPNHAEYEDTLRWVGGAFDPEAFDLNAVNQQLQRTVRPPRAKTLA